MALEGRAFDLHPDGMRTIGTGTPESTPVSVQNTEVLAFQIL